MSKREQRVIHAFINCVRNREFSADYATTLIEDQQRYGWLTDEAREAFYAGIAEDGEPSNEEPEVLQNEEVGNA